MSDKPDRKQGVPVPAGNNALTPRSSSALVKRGLEALSAKRGRVVRFPVDRSMGLLSIGDPTVSALFHGERLGEARGDVLVPSGKILELLVRDEAATDLRPLASLSADDLQILRLKLDGVGDAGMVHLRKLTLLEELWLWGAGIEDASLANIGILCGLKALMFRGGPRITDAGLNHLQNLTALERLAFGYTSIGDSGLSHLRRLTNLRTVMLTGCKGITGSGLAHLSTLPDLYALSLDETLINDAGLAYLRGLVRLTVLDLSHTSIKGTGLSNLHPFLSYLSCLNVSYTEIDETGMSEIERLTSLETLNLAGTHIADSAVIHLRKLPKLKNLDLSFTCISDVGLTHLQQLPSLESLTLSHTVVSKTGIEEFKQKRPNCTIEK